MDDILTLNRFCDLKGAGVRSADGEKIGSVNALFCDDQTQEPEWVAPVRRSRNERAGRADARARAATASGSFCRMKRDVLKREAVPA